LECHRRRRGVSLHDPGFLHRPNNLSMWTLFRADLKPDNKRSRAKIDHDSSIEWPWYSTPHCCCPLPSLLFLPGEGQWSSANVNGRIEPKGS
jgi:hypothetical protein